MPTASKGKALSFWLQRKRHRKRRRRGDAGAMPRSLQDLLTALEPEVFREERARCPITATQWQHAVGIRIADRSSPRRLDGDGTLLIAVTSSVWAQELSMLSSTVCQRLQVQGHNVKTVRFVVSAVEPARRAPERFESRYVPAPVPLPEDLQRDVDAIEDDQLRETMAKAIAASLAASLAASKHG